MQIQTVNSIPYNGHVGPVSATSSVPSAGFTLLSHDGALLATVPGDGSVLELGRSASSGVVLSNAAVSRKHASLKVNGGELWVRDEGSKNGTFVSGRALTDNWWHAVEAGESLRFGDVELFSAPAGGDAVSFARKAERLPTVGVFGFAMPGVLPSGAVQTFPPPLPAAAAVVGGPVGATLALQDLTAMAQRGELDSREGLLESLRGATAAMESGTGIAELPKGVPTLVIPDIHARREFLVKVMEHQVDGEKVYDLLRQGKMNVLCLGDGMHAEGRARERWLEAQSDFLQQRPSQAMNDEMRESLGTMQMVMELKTAFPENFHYLRGNHDEMNNPEREYAKYARMVSESGLVRSWVQDNLGQEFLEAYARFEKSMPLAATGEGLVATHAAPGSALSREEIERRDERAFTTLAWTDNTGWELDGREREVFQGNLSQLGSSGDHWLVGHRPVQQGLYRGQFDDRLVQVNAPGDYVVAIVGADGCFDPKKDIFSL